jgi:hypothetical protein
LLYAIENNRLAILWFWVTGMFAYRFKRKGSGKHLMTKRAFRPIAVTLSLLLLASVPAQASPVTLADVIQVISGNPRYGGQAPVMQLRHATQEDKTQQKSSSSTSTTPSSASTVTEQSGDVSTQQDPPVQAQTEEVGEIEVGDCDCGELPDEIVEIPGKRNFLPFLPLVGLICVTGICTPDENPTPTPISTPTPTEPIPEPATLFLFGSGLAALGARARRRHARAKLAQQANITEG